MILRRLTLANFRQFLGEQSIEFAQEPNGQNITVVYGENGRGKTGVFRAIVFCLYGDRALSQDGSVSADSLLLVNSHAIAVAPRGRPVDAFVELDLVHGETGYRIRRGLRGYQDGTQQHEELTDVRLTETDARGNVRFCDDPGDIAARVHAILDRRVRDYFLFDGEKIERLTRATSEQRREVALGIRNLLNVDALSRAIKATDRLQRKLDDEVAKHSTPDLERVLTRLRKEQERQASTTERLAQLGNESDSAEKELQDLDTKLLGFREIQGALVRREELEQQIEALERDLEYVLAEMRTQIGRSSVLLLWPRISCVFAYLQDRKQAGQIPPRIKRELIDQILAERKCICGQKVEPESDEHKAILHWRALAQEPAGDERALDLWVSLHHLNEGIEETDRRAERMLLQYANLRNNIEGLRLRVEEVSAEIASNPRGDASALEAQRSAVSRALVDLQAERARCQDELEGSRQEQLKLTAQRKQLEQERIHQSGLVRQAALARDTAEALHSVYDDFTCRIRADVGRLATDFFGRLIDPEGHLNLSQITVDEDYSLQLEDRWGRGFLANISAGQRQVMSVAFIAALARAASPGGTLEMPLFMDTPFGRLSFEHRRRMIEQVPTFCAQWVLLATDTELHRREARYLMGTGRWGRLYRLRSTPEGSTVMEEVRVDDSLPMFGESEVVPV